MRLRAAKRLSKYKFVHAEIPYDFWEEVRAYNAEITHDTKKKIYKCVIKTGRARLVRVHPCAFQLLRIVSQVVVDNCVSKFQRQPTVYRVMSNPLSKATANLVAERGLRVTGIHGYRHFRPQPIAPLLKEHPDVASAINAEFTTPAHLPESLVEAIDEYEHTSEVKAMSRMAPALVCLAAKPPVRLDREVAWDLFVMDCLELPIDDEGDIIEAEPPEFTAVEMSRQPQTTSASGLMPLSIQEGQTSGSKKQMHDAAVAVNLQDKLGSHVPPFNPLKPALKAEVIKKTKDVRAILLESQPNYMVLKHYFGCLASSWTDFAGGKAIGMSNRRGDFKTIPYSWWMESDKDHDEFLEWLSTQNAHESDKSKWESSTNATDGLPFLLGLILRVRVHSGDLKLVIRAIADYVRPHIQFDVGKAYSVSWRVPSGSFLTAYGNTDRHAKMAKWVIMWLARHGSAGSNSCTCTICSVGKSEGIPGWGTPLTDLQLRIMARFFVMGDDFIGLNPAPHVFDWVLDHVFGTTTKTVVKPFFSSKGSLYEPEGAEFLRRHFYLDRKTSPYTVRTFRAPARLLAKLFKGHHRHTKERFLAAVDSALNDVGANEPLFRLLRNLHFVIAGDGALNLGKYRDALQKYVRKTPLIEFMSLGYVPTYSDILNLDGGQLEPLLAVKRSDACKAIGMTPGMYMDSGNDI